MILKDSFRLYFQPKIFIMLFLGFASGLPLALTGSTLGVWLTESSIDKTTIGLFAAVATPYALKFLWSPLLDSLPCPVLGRLFGHRSGWLVAVQIATAVSLLLLGLANPAINPWVTASLALLVSACSASQDIVIDAYRVEMLEVNQQGAGSAMFVLGYRFGMIASTAGALYMATYFGWMVTYWSMAGLMGIGVLTVLIAGEPTRRKDAPALHAKTFSEWLRDAVIAPFIDFMKRDQWLAILLFILLYKLADAFLGVMANPFLIETGFTKEQIAQVVKLYGLIATIAGSFLGGIMVYKMGMVRTLWVCGIGHALTNLMFVVQAHVGADMHVLALGITLENITGGMGTAAFVAYLSSLCNLRFTATQYALLSSFASFGRIWLSTPAGWVAVKLGWVWFFTFASALAIPGLCVLWWLTRNGDSAINPTSPQAAET